MGHRRSGQMAGRPGLLCRNVRSVIRLGDGRGAVMLVGLGRVAGRVQIVTRGLGRSEDSGVCVRSGGNGCKCSSRFSSSSQVACVPVCRTSSRRSGPLVTSFGMVELGGSERPQLQVTSGANAVHCSRGLVNGLVNKGPGVSFRRGRSFAVRVSFSGCVPIVVGVGN